MNKPIQNHCRMNKKKVKIIKGFSQLISSVCSPIFVPFIAFFILFSYSYLKIPFQYKLIVLSAVFSFTVLMPLITIYLFRKINRLTVRQMDERRRRFFPYILTIVSYAFCLLIMYRINISWYMAGVVLTALVILAVLLLCNFRWKLSEHLAGIGGIIGGLVSFGYLFWYNPVWWICIFILLAGVLGSARILSRDNTFGEVFFGFCVGLVCSLLVLHPVSNFYFRLIFN